MNGHRNTFVDFQRSRLRRILKIKPGTGTHLFYQGMFVPEGEPLMDVFHYMLDEWMNAHTGYPIFFLIDNTGEYREANFEETEYIMGHQLEKREPDADQESGPAKL